ncbi:MAG TPA: serine/threonine-protein kinase [Kofleriaceae bacterium]|jgi:tetratricopeptide (TPR) repeat protein
MSHRAGTDDTIAAQSDDTLATSTGSESGASSRRGSRPSIASSPDYLELRVVDPDHYALVREIARGGMGRIWMARDRRLGRDVALKEVLVDSEAIVRRFEREARITARLQHPSIVGIHEAGVWPSGEPFYVMRLVSGRSLDEAIAATTSFAERLALLPNVLAVADAIAYAHGQRVIHRDLKPRNIVVGEFGETVVIDWGLAKDLGDSSDLETSFASAGTAVGTSGPGETTAGDILGTPSYMPPEQAAGQAVDERADVYAIGAMLYHVLANEPPYRSQSSAEVIAALMVEPPVPVSKRAPAAPTELVAIVERAMAREPAARYRTARELADDLRRFQTGQLVGAHRYSTGQLLRRWIRRHRTAIAAVAAAAIVGIVVGVVALRRIIAAERLVEQQRAEAVASRKDAEALSQFMMRDVENKLVMMGRPDMLDAIASRAVDYYDKRGDDGSDGDRYELAAARNVLGGGFAARGDLANARVQFDKAASLLAGLAVRNPDNVKFHTQWLRVRANLASIAQGPAGEQALRGITADADRLVAAHPRDPDALHVACGNHAHLAALIARRDPKAGLAESARSIELADTLEAVASFDTAEQAMVLKAHRTRGDLLRTAGHDVDGALREYRHAQVVGERATALDVHAPDVLDQVASLHETIGDISFERDDLTGAESEFQAGLAIAERLRKLDSTNNDWYRTQQRLDERIGMVLEARHDYPGALARYETCEGILAELGAASPNDQDLAHDRAILARDVGRMQAAMHQLPDALASLERAAAIEKKLLDADPASSELQSQLYETDELIGTTLAQAPGRARDALPILRDALAIATKLANQADLAATHADLGAALLQVRDLPAARVELHAALELAPHANDPSLAGRVRQDLARAK